MASRLGKDTIVLTMPGDKTDHGNQVDDWANAQTPRTVTGCYVELSLTEEDLLHRDATLAAGTIAAPAGTVVNPRDKVTWRGLDYRVDGHALEGRSISGGIDYIEIPINRWEG